MPEQGVLMQFVVVLCVIVGVERMVALVLKLLDGATKIKNRKSHANGAHEGHDTNLLVNSGDMRSLVDAIGATTRVSKEVLELLPELKRAMTRSEKSMDRFNN